MAWSLTETTAPAITPVTLAEAKMHLRITETTEDALVTNLIRAAVKLCQAKAKKQFITATYTFYLNEFPGSRGAIELPIAPVSAVDSVKYYDTAGTLQTLSTDVYQSNLQAQPAYIVTKANQVWPSVAQERVNSVEILFDAGFGDAATDVPECYRQALLLCVGHWYEHREAVSEMTLTDVPMAVNSLIAADGLVKIY